MNRTLALQNFFTPAWALISLGLIFGGAVGLYEIFVAHVLATTQVVTWTTPLVIYITMALTSTGISLLLAYGLLAGSAPVISNTRYLLVLDIAVLMGAFTALATELGSLLNLVYTFLSPNPTSPIWWMSVLYSAKLAVLFLKLFRDVLGVHGALDRPLSVITLIVAAGAAMTIGAVFGTNIARSGYRGAFASILLVLLAPTAGTALVVCMHRGIDLVAKVVPVFRQSSVLVAVLLALQWIYETRATTEGLLSWVNPLLPVVFGVAALMGGRLPRIAGVFALGGNFWVCYAFIITGQLSVQGPQQGWYGPVTSFTPNLAELLIIALGLAVAGALYQLGKLFLLEGPADRGEAKARPVPVNPGEPPGRGDSGQSASAPR